MDGAVKLNVILACRSGQAQDVQAILISLEGEPLYVEYCKVAMYEACTVGNADILKYLVCKSNSVDNLINFTDEVGETPLHVACRLLHVEVCKRITTSDACNVNMQSNSGQTPLHLAIRADCKPAKLEIIQLLLAIPDCDLNIQNSDGDTPLIVASHCSNVNNSLIINALVSCKKCDPNIQNYGGNTALHCAVVQNSLRVTQSLVHCKRYKPDLRNKLGETPLHITCSQLNVKGVTVLLKEGRCNVNAQTNTGQTPLHLAMKAKLTSDPMLKESVIRILLNVPNCDPHIADAQGVTPLQIAYKVCAGSQIIVLLLEKGCEKAYSKAQSMIEQAKSLLNDNLLFLIARKSGFLSFMFSLNSHPGDNSEAPSREMLISAVTVWDAKTVEKLLKFPWCDPNVRDDYGDTPLIIACKMANIQIINALLRHEKCDVSAQNHDGNTALHLATATCQDAIKPIILHEKYKPNLPNKLGETPLHIIACSKLNIQTVTVLLKEGRCNVNAQTNTGQTPLHLVLTAKPNSEQKNIVCLLLRVPHCDLNMVDTQGVTPLQIAYKTNVLVFTLMLERVCAEGYLMAKEVIDQALALTDNHLLHLLIHFGAITVMRKIIKLQGSPAIVNKGEEDSSGDTPLVTAIKTEHVEAVEVLLASQYCDPNVRTTLNGDTPLMIACKMAASQYTKGYLQILHLLLSNDRCDLNSQNDKGNTALHFAAAGNCQAAVTALVGHKRYKPNLVNNHGESPVHVACGELNMLSVRAILRDQKCKINLQTNTGQTPLHLAVGAQEVIPGSKLELINLLLSYPNCKASNTDVQDTTLHSQECDPTVRNSCDKATSDTTTKDTVLFHQQCDPNIRNSSGETPLHIAVKGNKSDIITALLLHSGCDPNVQNVSSETPLHIACKLGKYDCVVALTRSRQCNINVPDNNGHTALHKAIHNLQQDDLSILEHLIADSRCDVTACDLQGNTALHIACTKAAWRHDESIAALIRILLSTGKVDPQCINSVGETPIQCAVTNEQVVQELSSFSTAQLDHPVQTFVKMFIVGNAETGKSTLVESLRTDASWSRRFVPSHFKTVKGVKPHTAGIVPVPVNNRHFGNAVIYDFAGQHEYYSSHAAVLENLILSSPPVFLLTVNLSEPFNDICETVSYWWSFIGSYSTRSNSSPHVIIVGSHKDLVKSRGEKVQEIRERLLATMEEVPTNFTLVNCVTLDCRKVASEDLTKLLSTLKHTCEKVRRDVKIDLRCPILSSFLSDTLSTHMTCSLAQIIDRVKAEGNTLLPQSTVELVNLLAALSDKDRILLLKNSEHPEDSWIILQRQKLFGDINGSIFAPEYFAEYIPDFAGNTGIVPVSKLKKHFPQYPLEVITGFLSHLQFCFKIGDALTLKLITTEEIECAPDEEFYFFPALVSRENPPEENVWGTSAVNRQLKRRYGWLYECSRRYQYLMSRFLHVLILRLAFSYALAMKHEPAHDLPVVCRRCSVWKRGIAWRNNDGIETVVEVGLQKQWLVVMMQCPIGMEAECTELRRSVIKTVLDAKQEFCPEVTMNEYLMHPGITDYPFQHTKQLALYSMKEICKVVIEGKTYVVDKGGLHQSALAELLPCEPYIGLGKRLITHLFVSECEQDMLSDRDLDEVVQGAICSNPDLSQQKLKLFARELLPSIKSFFPPSGISECVVTCTKILQQATPITFQILREVLSRFSILCGRNPWDISGLSPPIELLESRFNDSNFGQPLEKTNDRLLGIESLLEVRTEVIPAISQTASLGLALGLSQASKLQVIQYNWPDDVAFQLTEVMAAWLQGMGNSSWRSLAKALLDPAVDCPAIAHTIMEHHSTHGHSSHPNEDDVMYQEVDEAPLDEISLSDVLPAVVQGGHFSWFHLGLVLGLHYGTLKTIKIERTSHKERVAFMMAKWLNQVDSVRQRGQPSWRVLARAFAHPLIEQNRLADDIARDHPAPEVTSTSADESLTETASLCSSDSSGTVYTLPHSSSSSSIHSLAPSHSPSPSPSPSPF